MKKKPSLFNVIIAWACVLSLTGNSFASTRDSGAGSAVPTPPKLSEVLIDDSGASGGFTIQGKVVLDAIAPSAIAVTLNWDQKTADFPKTVIIPAGQNTATFVIGTPDVAEARSAKLSAEYNGMTRSASLSLTAIIEHRAPRLSRISIAANEVAGKKTVLGKVVLGGTARKPVLVTLASDNKNADVPASVTVPTGESSESFEISTSRVKEDQKATIRASFNNNNRTAALTLKAEADPDAAKIKDFTLDPDEVVGGAGAKGKIAMSAKAEVNIFVALTSESDFTAVPTGITISAGQDSAQFNIATSVVEKGQKAKLTASFNGVNKTVVLSVKGVPPMPKLAEFSVDADDPLGGKNAKGQVGLSDKAPNDISVTLASDHPSVKLPLNIVIAKNQDSATFSIPTTPVNQDQKVILSASFNGLAKTVSWTVKSPKAQAPKLADISLDPSENSGVGKPAETEEGVKEKPAKDAKEKTPEFGRIPSPVGRKLAQTDAGFISVKQQDKKNIGIPPELLKRIPEEMLERLWGEWRTRGFTYETVDGRQTKPDEGFAVIRADDGKALWLGGIGTHLGPPDSPPPPTPDPNKNIPPTLCPSGSWVVARGLCCPTGHRLGKEGVCCPSHWSPSRDKSKCCPDGWTINLRENRCVEGIDSANPFPPVTEPPILASLAIEPDVIQGGRPTKGKITLSKDWDFPVPVVLISKNRSAVVLPFIIVPKGRNSAEFTIETTAVGQPTNAAINASFNGVTKTANLKILSEEKRVEMPMLASIELEAISFTGGQAAKGRLRLTGEWTEPISIDVISNSPNSLAVASNKVTVPKGEITASFEIPTKVVSQPTDATLTASFGGAIKYQMFQVVPPDEEKEVDLQCPPGKVWRPSPNRPMEKFVCFGGQTPAQCVAARRKHEWQYGTCVSENQPELMALSVNPEETAGGKPARGTIRLTHAAEEALGILLISGNPTVVVPSTVHIPEGRDSAEFTIETKTGAPEAKVVITASLNRLTKSATLSLKAPIQIASIEIEPKEVTGSDNKGKPVKATVTLNEKTDAPAIVRLGTKSEFVTIPESVTVEANKDKASFDIETKAVTQPEEVKIGAAFGGSAKLASLRLLPTETKGPELTEFTLEQAEIPGRKSVVGRLKLSGKPAAPVFIELDWDSDHIMALSWDSRHVTTPRGVSIRPNEDSAAFTFETSAVEKPVSVKLSAKLGNVTKTVSLRLDPPAAPKLVRFALEADGNVTKIYDIRGGKPIKAEVTLSDKALADIVVALASDNPYASVPKNVTVSAGKNNAEFTIETKPCSDKEQVAVSATLGEVVKTKKITLMPTPGEPLTFKMTPSGRTGILAGQSGFSGEIRFDRPVPADAEVVLASNNQWIQVPGSVKVRKGETAGSFPIHVPLHAEAKGEGTITARLGEYVQTAVLVITPAATLAEFTLEPTEVLGGQNPKGKVKLTAKAAAEVVVGLHSKWGAIKVPRSLTIPAGQDNASFDIETTPLEPIAAGRGQIEASLAGVVKEVILAVKATPSVCSDPPVITLQASPSRITEPDGSAAVTLTGKITAGGKGCHLRGGISLSDNSTYQDNVSKTMVDMDDTGKIRRVWNSSTKFDAESGEFTTVVGIVRRRDAQDTTLNFRLSAVNNFAQAVKIVSVILPAVDSARLESLTLESAESQDGKPIKGTVKLSAPTAVETKVAVESDNDAAKVAPPSVSIPQGKDSADFNIMVGKVETAQKAKITATLGNNSKTAILTILPAPAHCTVLPVIVKLDARPVRITEPDGSATVTITAKTSPGGAGCRYQSIHMRHNATYENIHSMNTTMVSMDNNTGRITMTRNSSTQFDIETGEFVTVIPIVRRREAQEQTINFYFWLANNYANTDKSVSVILPAAAAVQLEALTLEPEEIVPIKPGYENQVKGAVQLAENAAIDVKVELTSDDGHAQVRPDHVIIAAGKKQASFDVFVPIVGAVHKPKITARHGASSVSRQLTIKPQPTALLESIEIDWDIPEVTGGNEVGGVVTLAGPASVATVVAIESDNTLAKVPANVTIPAGKNSVVFTIKSDKVDASQQATIAAVLGSVRKTAKLTIKPKLNPKLESLELDRDEVDADDFSRPVKATVKLAGQAPQAAEVYLGDMNKEFLNYPLSVTIAAGQSQASFDITKGPNHPEQTKTLTIRAALDMVNKIAPLTLNVRAQALLESVTVEPDEVTGDSGDTIGKTIAVKVTVKLNDVAAADAKVAIDSDDAEGNAIGAKVGLPSDRTLVITKGTDQAFFWSGLGLIKNFRARKVTYTATLGKATKTGKLTIKSVDSKADAKIDVLDCDWEDAVPGSNHMCKVDLTEKAAANTVVLLESDNDAVRIPKSVTILAGKTSADIRIETAKDEVGQGAILTATLNGASSRSRVKFKHGHDGGGGGLTGKSKTYTANDSFTPPPGVTGVWVEIWGGGGGAGGSGGGGGGGIGMPGHGCRPDGLYDGQMRAGNAGRGGHAGSGGGGGWAKAFIAVTPEKGYPVTVGEGGDGGEGGSGGSGSDSGGSMGGAGKAGKDGGASSFAGLQANGGKGGGGGGGGFGGYGNVMPPSGSGDFAPAGPDGTAGAGGTVSGFSGGSGASSRNGNPGGINAPGGHSGAGDGTIRGAGGYSQRGAEGGDGARKYCPAKDSGSDGKDAKDGTKGYPGAVIITW